MKNTLFGQLMRSFIHNDFLLHGATARRLYHEHAAGLPIIDYHCHLDPRDLAEDRVFEDITQLWIAADPYKHRAMRIAGVPERCITGNATAREKFDCWAATAPMTLGNPLYHWTALELQRYFGIDEPLGPATAGRIWEECNRLLRREEFTARQLIARSGTECVCTSDRLLDDLRHHETLTASTFRTRVLPSLRADDITAVDQAGYAAWLGDLQASTGCAVNTFDGFRQAIVVRLDRFGQLGCRLADHALDDFSYTAGAESETARLYERRAGGEAMEYRDRIRLKSGLLRFLGAEYSRRGWIMQLHIGAQRQTSSRLRTLAGPAGGYASIGKACDIPSLCAFLDDLEKAQRLPRTILYTLNPADNAALAALTGSFAEDGVRGKVQFGPAWWYNDHALGIRRHLEDLASFGLLPAFIGMTTDSRSLLSMVRHEYFRRLLCDFFGTKMDSGEFPPDAEFAGQVIRDITYNNARRWVIDAGKGEA